jgi:hypothetical protein
MRDASWLISFCVSPRAGIESPDMPTVFQRDRAVVLYRQS